MKINIIMILIAFSILSSCMPEDNPVKPYDRGNVILRQVLLGVNYKKQIFYKLNDSMEVRTNDIADWDLAFSCMNNSYNIMLNMATFMNASDLGSVDFEDVTNKNQGINWIYEKPEGYLNIDSTSIGVWYEKQNNLYLSKNHVYIIDRGFNEEGKKLGIKKMMVISADEAGYDIRVADLNNSNTKELHIDRNPALNYIMLSLSDGQIKEIEPPSTDWDFVFSKYTYIFYEPEYLPYSVVGLLLNPKYSEAALDTTSNFKDITADSLPNYSFTNQLDFIGYDWKDINITTGVYTVLPWKNYIIKDRLGFYYKLHFVGFEDENGLKGAPKFEFQKL